MGYPRGAGGYGLSSTLGAGGSGLSSTLGAGGYGLSSTLGAGGYGLWVDSNGRIHAQAVRRSIHNQVHTSGNIYIGSVG